MGEHARTAEARRDRMQAACTSIVAALDGHVDTLTTEDAIKTLGFVIATYALAWGQPREVITAIGQIAWDTAKEIEAAKAKVAEQAS